MDFQRRKVCGRKVGRKTDSFFCLACLHLVSPICSPKVDTTTIRVQDKRRKIFLTLRYVAHTRLFL